LIFPKVISVIAHGIYQNLLVRESSAAMLRRLDYCFSFHVVSVEITFRGHLIEMLFTKPLMLDVMVPASNLGIGEFEA
jgi:hypothetical protein